MPTLDRVMRHAIRDGLESLPDIDSPKRRKQLIRDMPAILVNSILYSDVPADHIANIVEVCLNWEPAPANEPHPLGLLLTNARWLVKGPQRERLQNLFDLLPDDFKVNLSSDPELACPYPGMVPFDTKNARFFHGRKEEVEELLYRLRTQHFQLVIGPSGSGKSSLILAGLLPRLITSSLWPPSFFRVVTMRPGAQPTEKLVQHLGGDPTQAATTIAALLARHPPAQRLLLVIDQFEEVFTQADREEQNRFIAALPGLYQQETCAIVLTMRADFYPDLMNSAMWQLGKGRRLEIAPLRGQGLRKAIREPAAEVGVEVEDGLVERLLADAAEEPGRLPLLQETLVSLWDQMEGRLLTLENYEALEQDGRSGLMVTMARNADATYNSLNPPQQILARRILLRLIHFGEDGRHTRRQQRVTALRATTDDPALFAETLDRLIEARLVIVSGDDQSKIRSDDKGEAGRTVDIAHEALIKGWPTLSGWIDDPQKAEQTRRRLEDKAAEWVRLKRGTGGLLDEFELPEVTHWLASSDAVELGASADLKALADASRNHLAAAQQRSARFTRWLQLLTVGLTLMLCLALIAAWWAQEQGHLVERQLRVAQAQTIAAKAVERLEHDPDLSILLAIEAVSVTRQVGEPLVPDAEAALRSILQRSALRQTLWGHTDRVMDAQYSPDGGSIVTASRDGTLKIWNAATAQVRHTLQSSGGRFWSASFSHDGRYIVAANADHSARVWNADTGQLLPMPLKHDDEVLSAQYSPDDRRIVTTSFDKTAKIWDAQTAQLLQTLKGHTEQVFQAAWSPDGQRIVTASQDHTAKVWDAFTGRTLSTLKGHTAEVNSAVYSPKGETILTTSWDYSAQVWDVVNRTPRRLQGKDLLFDGVYSPDGRSVIAGGADGSVKVWDLINSRERDIMLRSGHWIRSVASSPDGKYIVTSDTDHNTATIWDAGLGGEAPTLDHKYRVRSAAYSPDGQRIVTGSEGDNTARIWDALTGTLRLTLPGHTERVDNATFSSNGQRIVTASWDRTAKVWNSETGQEMLTLQGHSDKVMSAVFSPNDQSILTISADGTARVWDAATGQVRWKLRVYTGTLEYAAAVYSPDGRHIATAGSDGIARVWDAATGQEILTMKEHTAGIQGIVYSPDGMNIATASRDGTARIWDAGTGKVRRIVKNRTDDVPGLAYRPDGQQFVTVNSDKTVTIWDAATGQEQATLQGHTAPILRAAYSPDGRFIATASDDGTVRQYASSIDGLLAIAAKRVTRSLTSKEQSEYLNKP